MQRFGRWQAFLLVLFVLSIGFSVYLLTLQLELGKNQDLLAANVSSLEAEQVRQAVDIALAKAQIVSAAEQVRSDLKSDLANLETNLTGKVDRQSEKLDTEFASLNKLITAQGSDVRTLATGLSDLKVADASLVTKVSSAQTQLGALSAKVDGLKVVDFNAINRDIWPSVFMIETDGGWGTGFLVDSGLIMTAGHVVVYSNYVTVRQAGAPSFTGQVFAVDRGRDVALIKFNPSASSFPSYAKPLLFGEISPINIASPLMALGYSDSGVWADGSVGSANANVGVLSQITNFGVPLGLNLMMDVPVDPGDSGGPIVDQNGRVVGMVRARRVGDMGTFYAVHIDEIRAALPALKSGQSR